MGLTLQGVPLVREWCSSRSPCPPDVAGRPNSPRGDERERPPSGPCSRDESVLPSGSRRNPTVDAFLGFPPAESSPHPPGPSLVVTMPALSSLGGIDVPTHLDPRASRIEWIGLARFRAACSLEVLHLATVAALRSSSRGAGSWFSPHAGRRALHATPTAIQAPSRSMQSQILGPQPGATVHRCSTGHLVRSSALVFSMSVACRSRRED